MPDPMQDPVVAAQIVDAVAPGKELNTAALPAQPITVNSGSAVPLIVTQVTGYLTTVFIAFALGRDWIGKDDVVQVTAAIAGLVPIVWGAIQAYRNHQAKAALEPFAPAAVAKRA